MVHTSIMTASMAGEEQLVFHDFLGMTCHAGDSVQQSELEALNASLKVKHNHQARGIEREEMAVKVASTSSGHIDESSPSMVVSGAEQFSWSHGSGGALQAVSIPGLYKPEVNNGLGKRRDSGDIALQQLNKGIDMLETSPLSKISRLEKLDERKIGHVESSRDSLHSPMQPPRVSLHPQTLHPSLVAKPGLNTIMSSKWDNSKHLSLASSMFGPAQVGLLNTDKVALSNTRDSSIIIPRPPADEGSRTGLKGSSAGILLNSPSANPIPGPAYTNPSSGRSKSWSQSAGSESMYIASQQTTMPTGRQLTIFYGGQAHVFDDVPSDKADAIMTLAGSSGRSWSTMYTPRSKTSMLGGGSEGPQSMVDREKSASKSIALHGAGLSASGVPNVGFQTATAAGPTENHAGMPSFSDSRGMPIMRSISAGEIRKQLS